MKEFIKYTLASLLGVVLAGVVLTILSIVTLAGMLSSSGAEPVVKENSIFILDLEGELRDRSTDIPFANLLGSEYESVGLTDVLASIKKAEEHSNIKGIYLKIGDLYANSSSLEEIRAALLRFKESGKFLVSYADSYTQNGYYLASVADKIVLNPQGSLTWKGLSMQSIFFKEALAKLGIEMEVFKVGRYKSAVEPFVATEMSAENREQLTAYAHSVWKEMITSVSDSRAISIDSLNQYADELVEFQPAECYLAYGLVDSLLYHEPLLHYLKELSGREADEKLRSLDLADMCNLNSNRPKDKSGNLIAVYYATGEIDGSSLSLEGIDSKKMCKELRRLRDEESVKGVVLRINSPGGSAYGSEQIWQEVKALREKKPVVVSMGDYAASGGYYIASAADYILANTTTLTGSIGIFGMIPNAQELLTKKLGLHFEAVTTHSFADMGSVGRSLKSEERVAIQKAINNGYETFVNRCATGRNLPVDSVKQVGEGRIWSGEMAAKVGLVDELGGLQRAIEVVAERAGVVAYTLQSYPAQDSFIDLLLTTKNSLLQAELKSRLGYYYSTLQFMEQLSTAEPVQARIPFELIIE